MYGLVGFILVAIAFFSFSLLFVACDLLNLMHYFPQSISFSRLWFFFFPCISRDLSFCIKLSWLSFFCPPWTFRTVNKLFVPWCGMKMLHLGNDPARFKLFNRISAWWNPKSHDFVASVMTLCVFVTILKTWRSYFWFGTLSFLFLAVPPWPSFMAAGL